MHSEYLWNTPLSGFLQRKLLKSCAVCCVVVIRECGDLSCTIYILNFPTSVSHKSLPLPGTSPPGNWHQNFLRRFPADSYWNTLHQIHKLLTGMSDSTHVVTGPNGLPRNALPVAEAVHDASLFADS